MPGPGCEINRENTEADSPPDNQALTESSKMTEPMREENRDREDLLHSLIQIVEETVADWETGWEGRINADTCFVEDLGFHSVDIITLAVRIEEHFQCRGIPFQRLLMTP